MTTEAMILYIFCYGDDRMGQVAKHPQAKLYPSEWMTIGLLAAPGARCAPHLHHRWPVAVLLCAHRAFRTVDAARGQTLAGLAGRSPPLVRSGSQGHSRLQTQVDVHPGHLRDARSTPRGTGRPMPDRPHHDCLCRAREFDSTGTHPAAHRRTWSLAHDAQALWTYVEWGRAYYHFCRYHEAPPSPLPLVHPGHGRRSGPTTLARQ